MVVEQAPGISYMWHTNYALRSADVSAPMNPYFSSWDLSFTSVSS